MATVPVPPYITIDEFDRMQFDDERAYELLDGEIVEVGAPELFALQTDPADRACVLDREVPFRIYLEPKLSADVAVVSVERDRGAVAAVEVAGGPEVLPPSNLTSRDRQTARLSLKNGALPFWIVDPHDCSVDVYSTYERGSSIALPSELSGGSEAILSRRVYRTTIRAEGDLGVGLGSVRALLATAYSLYQRVCGQTSGRAIPGRTSQVAR